MKIFFNITYLYVLRILQSYSQLKRRSFLINAYSFPAITKALSTRCKRAKGLQFIFLNPANFLTFQIFNTFAPLIWCS
jgi:hypothetical protein